MVSASRVKQGATHQENLANYLIAEGFKIKSVAKQGSNEPDIIASKKYRTIQIEVKGAEGFNESGTFDVTMNRLSTTRHPKSKPKDIRRMNELVRRIAESNNYTLDRTNKNYIEQYIDLIRKTDKTIGFAGDIGAAKSGSITVEYFKTSNESVIDYALRFAKDHLKESGDDYFCLVNSLKNDFVIFGPSNDNLFDDINIRSITVSDIRSIRLKTAGAASNGRVRVSLMLSYNKDRFSRRIKSF